MRNVRRCRRRLYLRAPLAYLVLEVRGFREETWAAKSPELVVSSAHREVESELETALMRQAEDRAYRLGQLRDVMVIVPLIENTLDDGVWKLLQNKQETEDDVVESVRSALPGELAMSVDAANAHLLLEAA